MMRNDQNSTERGLTVCFTGHRNISYEDALRLPALLDRVLTDLIGDIAVTRKAHGQALPPILLIIFHHYINLSLLS